MGCNGDQKVGNIIIKMEQNVTNNVGKDRKVQDMFTIPLLPMTVLFFIGSTISTTITTTAAVTTTTSTVLPITITTTRISTLSTIDGIKFW